MTAKYTIIEMLKENKQYFLLFFAFIFLLYTHRVKTFNPKPIIQVSEQHRQANFNAKAIDIASVGQRRFLASLLWIQTLLDGDLEHYKGGDLNSWMYLRFKSIITLDPLFYEAYLWGGQYLSIVKDDVLGAEEIYKAGLERFPHDLDLNFNAGFNRFFELSETALAIENFDEVVRTAEGMRRYPRLMSLVHKMKKEDGVSYSDIFENLKFKLQVTKDPKLQKYVKELLYSVRATEDLLCLNSGAANCRTKDLSGQDYIQKKGRYFAQRAFRPFKIHRRKESSKSKN